MDHLGTVSLGIWLKCGSAYEDMQNNGMSHMVEHMIFKGTDTRSASELSEDMTYLGSGFDAFTTKEFTCYYFTVLSEHLDKAVSLFSDMIQHSVFDEEEFRREKDVVLDEIALYNDSPDDAVHEMLEKSVWFSHPLGFQISGEEKKVKSFSRDQVYEYYRKKYTAENMIISAAGNFDDKKLLDLLNDTFGSIPEGNESRNITTPEYKRCIYYEEKDTDQIYLNLCMPGCTVNASDRFDDSMVQTILGGSESSRLFRKIRDEKGLTYSVSSYSDPYICAGLTFIDLVIDHNRLKDAVRGIIDILADLSENGVTENELTRTREQVKSEIMIADESSRFRMENYGKGMLFRNEPSRAEATIEKINKTDHESAERAIKKYYDHLNASVSVIGPVTSHDVDYIKKITNINTVLAKK